MPRGRAATSTSQPARAKAAQAQSDLVRALERLDMQYAARACGNAGLHADVASLLAALRDAVTKDADAHERQRTRAAAKAAGIPFPSASAAQFDAGAGRGVSKHELALYEGDAWITAGESLCILGKTQMGKSYLASIVALAALRRGRSVLYRPVSVFLRDWFAAYREGPNYLEALRQRIRETDLLVLDAFGEGPMFQHDLGTLREVITERFDEDGKSLCIVSSVDAAQWLSWMSGSDEGKAVVARLDSAFRKLVLERAPKKNGEPSTTQV